MTMAAATLAVRAARLRHELAGLEVALLDAADRGELSITAVANALGHSRQTVYARLAERQSRRDALSTTDPPPAEEAPADDHDRHTDERTP